MLDPKRDIPGPVITAEFDRDGLAVRVRSLAKELGREPTVRVLAIVSDRQRSHEQVRDAVSTLLMEGFRQHGSRGAFGLLYELNSQHLVTQVASCLRRYGSRTDPRDVLQEVFFNVYRYPHRFNCEREDAFRVWSAMIVRNTVLKHLRGQGRTGRVEVPFEDLSDQPEERAPSPLRGVIDGESARECGRVYLTYLHLYLRFYSMLSQRERKAIHLVEVEEKSYRDAADQLSIKLENLKMVIFRARRKIHRSMRRVFEGLPPDCRPARDPRALEAAAAPHESPRAGHLVQGSSGAGALGPASAGIQGSDGLPGARVTAPKARTTTPAAGNQSATPPGGGEAGRTGRKPGPNKRSRAGEVGGDPASPEAGDGGESA